MRQPRSIRILPIAIMATSCALLISMATAWLGGLQGKSGPVRSTTLSREINAIAVAPDGKSIAIATGETPFPNSVHQASDVYIWTELPLKQRFRAASIGWMQAIEYSPDGSLVACAGEGLEVWNTQGLSLLFRDTTLQACKALAFSPDGTELVVVDANGILTRFGAHSGKKLGHWQVSDNYAFAVAFTPDGRELVTGGDYDGRLKYWDARTGKLLRMVKAHSETIDSIAFSRDGRYMATGSWDDTARIWEAKTRKLLHELKGHSFNVWSVAFDRSGSRVVTTSSEIKVWSVSTGKEIKTITSEGMHAIFANGDHDLGGYDGKKVEIWRAPDGRK